MLLAAKRIGDFRADKDGDRRRWFDHPIARLQTALRLGERRLPRGVDDNVKGLAESCSILDLVIDDFVDPERGGGVRLAKMFGVRQKRLISGQVTGACAADAVPNNGVVCPQF